MKYVAPFLIAAFTLLIWTVPVEASVNDFVINDFSSDYVLDNNKPGGSLDATEHITVTFSDQNHGIFRYIPKSYKSFSTKLHVDSVSRDGAPEQYDTSSDGSGNLVMKIGDPDRTITGRHEYLVHYHQERIINFAASGPEFYWDITGNGWQQPIEHVQAKVTLNGKPLEEQAVDCYTGLSGGNGKDCTAVKGGSIAYATTRTLNPGEGITVYASMPAGYFIQPTWHDKLRDQIGSIIGIALSIIGAIWALAIWLRYGRDEAGRKVIVPEYEPPKGLTPAEIGMLADFKLDSRDLTATLIDLAVRGYVRLHEDEAKRFFIDVTEYSIELVKSDFSQLNETEKNMLEAIFSKDAPAGKKVAIKSIDRAKMAQAVQKSREKTKKSLIDTYGLVESRYPKSYKLLIAAAVVYVIATFYFRTAGFIIGTVIIIGSLILAAVFMQRRTHAGVETNEKIQGLKLYLNVAEKDRLKMMQSTDRPYAEPEKTVHLYEKLLPYAVALGVEKSWTKQFKNVLTERPDWFESSYSSGAFYPAAFASSLNNVSSGFGSMIQTSSSTTGSSGAGGGGFSGGGGGGGGGGGW